MSELNYLDEIRAFDDSDVKEAIYKLSQDTLMHKLLGYVFSENSLEKNKSILNGISTIQDFQSKIIHKGLKKVIQTTLKNLSFSGLENISKDNNYLFISNHRDIVLDPSLLNMILFENKFKTTQIAIGDNLTQNTFSLLMAKMNKTFIIKRSLGNKESVLFSKSLSQYISNTLKKESIWMAQREGRTKDGKDKTNKTIIKMIYLSNKKKPFIDFIRETNIVPMSISYEYDPTDYLKAREIVYNDLHNTYKKRDNEDFESIIKGFNEYKKNVHIHIGKPLNKGLDKINEADNINNKTQSVCNMIDDCINKNYKIWTSNLIAYDILYKTNKYSELYTKEELDYFVNRMDNRIKNFDSKIQNLIKTNLLSIYSNCLI